ncbi:MAG: dUTPase [Nanoarchaeota archaeon]|nr:dUTPase [Nanoarchaeota archaeon]|tara:strand:+ start:284 stop:706 length:423 start_codon:yes stop_codon:yes gene_type:complete
MHVKIKRVDKSLPLPEYKTSGAVAFDVLARETVEIASQTIGRVPVNVVIEIPPGYMLLLKDRSSTPRKKGLLCTVGFIDQDFCGETDEIQLQFFNFNQHSVFIERGERLGQASFVRIDKCKWMEVDDMSTNDRGGFGSTG